ncbi:MAG: hypoxanthine phosphoribosyltransferase [Chlamydiota bacterium]
MNKMYVMMLCLISSMCFSIDCPMDVIISSERIAEKIKESAELLEKDYQDKNLTIVMVMKGAICVTSDLIRQLKMPFTLECVKASSYGHNGTIAGELTISGLDSLEIEGRDVLIVDDIFETGNTILGISKQLEKKHPKSIKTLVLLVKDIKRKVDYRPDYVLFDIQNRFVIGYGLDYKELYRGLPDICAFIGDKPPF